VKIKWLGLFFGLFFLLPKVVFAQSLGYNIVNNFFKNGVFDAKAFELIARQNPGGTVTVRLVSQELRAHPDLISLIQSAASQYGLSVVWQPEDWSTTTPQQFRDFWLPYLQKITMGKISLFTEYNYHYGNPGYYAQILVAALQGGLKVPIATTNFNLTNPTGTNPYGQPMVQYVDFLKKVKTSCASLGQPNCLNKVPVWAVSIYGRGATVGAQVDDFIRQLKAFKAAVEGLGVSFAGKQIIIPEAGIDPGIPIQQRLVMAARFITALEQKLAADPELAGLIDSMTFLFMDDKTGKQYLLVKDENGNWIVLEYKTFGLVGQSGPVGGESDNVGTTQGRSFIVEKTVCWNRYDEAVKAIIRSLQFNISKNEKTAKNLRQINTRLIPPGEEDMEKKNQSEGEIAFEVCENNTDKWFNTEETIKVAVPKTYQQASTNGIQVAGFLYPPEAAASGQAKTDGVPTANKKTGPIIAAPQLAAGDYVDIASFSCTAAAWQISCTVVVNAGLTGHIWVHANGQMLGFNTIGNGLTYYYKTGAAGAKPTSYTVNVSAVNHDLQPKLSASASCTIEFDQFGNGACSGSGVPPEPPMCKPKNNNGDSMGFEEKQAEGAVKIPIKHGYSTLQSFLEALGRIGNVCRDVEFVFTPITSIPFTFPDETTQRERVYQVFAPPEEAEKYQFKHGAAPAEFGIQASPETVAETELDIFGQKGVDNARRETIKLLTPD